MDHIVPTCRGGNNNYDNLQFVYSFGDFDINFMKGSLTNLEFIDTIKMIYGYLTKKD